MRELSARSWLAVCVVGVVGAALGSLFALHRRPVYSSTATVSSARVNVLAQALPAYVEAATSLASTYSRMTMTDAVERPAAKRLGLSLGALRARVAATPVPDDPVLRIVATGPSPHAAARAATVTAQELVSYVSDNVTLPRTSAKMLSQYATLSLQVRRLNAEVARLRPATAPAQVAQRNAASRQLAESSLRVHALASAYIQRSLNATSGAAPQILTAATPAASDRVPKLEEYGGAGLIIGLLAGLGAVRYVSGRSRTRRIRAFQAV